MQVGALAHVRQHRAEAHQLLAVRHDDALAVAGLLGEFLEDDLRGLRDALELGATHLGRTDGLVDIVFQRLEVAFLPKLCLVHAAGLG